jgi:two-component system phosphate regulon response regulator OmpR
MPTPGASLPHVAGEPDPPFHTAAPGSKVWIVDDDEGLCLLLERRLGSGGWRIHCFPTPEAFETALERDQPDLLVLDEMLPRKPGTQLLASLRQWGYRFPVLMLSALAEPHHRLAGLEEGADDYVGKPFLSRELQLRIEHLLTRSALPLAPSRRELPCFSLANLRFDPVARTLCREAGKKLPLTPGETALLLALCRSEGRILSREQLLLASGSLVDTAQSRTIDVRIAKLRRQLQLLSGRNDLIESVRGRGYRLHPEARVRLLSTGEKGETG